MHEVVEAASTGNLFGLVLAAIVQVLRAPSGGSVGHLNLGLGIDQFCPLPPAYLVSGVLSDKSFLLESSVGWRWDP